MLQQRTNGTDATLSFWKEAARRLSLADVEKPVTTETLDRLMSELQKVSYQKTDQDYPFVPPLIRLFAVHDDEFFSLLEGYGEKTLDPEIHDALTGLMKEMPGLWAMAAEIKMARGRLGWMATSEAVRHQLGQSY